MKTKKKFSLLIILVILLSTGCSGGESAYVYYLNHSPEADAAWQEIAAEYTEKTGVPVKVVTAASGTYPNTLSAQMCKNDKPTLFAIRTSQELTDWKKYCYDISKTKLFDLLETTDSCLYDEEHRLCAMGYCIQTYGIIANKTLLLKSGHTLSEIKNFETLKAVAEDIHKRKDELGFDAFTSAGLESSSSWRFSAHLANMPLFYEFTEKGINSQPSEIEGKYLDLYKNIWDLYINNSSTSPAGLSNATATQAEEEFGSGKAVFFQNGVWEYSALTAKDGLAMKPEDLTMIPIYCGMKGEENAGLCSGTDDCWAINSDTDQANIDATIEFINWLITSDRGKKMMEHQFGLTPFKEHQDSDDPFIIEAMRLEKLGRYNVNWVFKYTPNTEDWRLGVVSALESYSAGKADWDAVKRAFVEGWSYQYKREHCIVE
ncbi:MAG: ABC transporter substrate-binding protein [Eubacterium sp.]|nr:ABC transporter substrate-binding protein [Eubacterium sp.]